MQNSSSTNVPSDPGKLPTCVQYRIASSGELADVEKVVEVKGPSDSPIGASTGRDKNDKHDPIIDVQGEALSTNKFLVWTYRLERLLGFETRGIHRVKSRDQTDKTTLSFLQIVMMWFSINTAAQNVTLGSLGQSVFELGFVDATVCSVLGGLVGTIPVAYTAGWGPWSGNRTMICARFSMGWWPVKLCVLLNLVILIGYAMIDAVVAGQILSAVSSNGSVSVEVGIVITAVLTFIVTTFGIRFFHHYERYAWIPSIIIFFILLGTTARNYDTQTPSIATGRTLMGNRLSFFSVCLSAAITYSPGAADFLVYCNPQRASRLKVALATMIGLGLSFTLCFIIGCGLSATSRFAEEAGSGALLVAGFSSLDKFGSFCSVLTALGLIANMVPPVYSSGIDFQILGRYTAIVPRFLWNTVAVIIFMVCALAGKNSLSEIFTNFLALMGYWVVLWIAITLEEEFIFRPIPALSEDGRFNWIDWNVQERLPIGLAALTAFLLGWVGAILCMAQVYYIGPIAKEVGDFGADMGNYVGFALAAVIYAPLRWLEIRKFGR
ncbi:permease for cytosine/purines, uracil, thiamine, allantoin-domain-containing protein [Amylocarpus encephaloides]|uniref:Permease for cytosine/purines, uracil, thiamine, allantoin-domain-containing protein n=1 Tax=Amylocarpus encephaloides TaxID=45428 RepID=A0A9P7YH32_9HELO|nr:permease for cytosine/purines, uracil, thiamine, allantoin-domain-containing protein [Amylocarpus encephaloides]